jgi:hypothetical protein
VINGHIIVIQSLHYYYLLEPKEETLDLICAGVATMHRYISEVRVPEDIHRYGVYEKAKANYGQLRNLNQMKWLYEITGEPYFSLMRSVFAADYMLSGKKIQ